MPSQFTGTSSGVRRISVLLSTTRRNSSTPRRFTPQSEGQYGLELVSQRATTSCLSRIVWRMSHVNDSTPNFEPTRIGTTPTSIPPSACLIDDTSPLITTNGKWDMSSGADKTPLGSYWYNSTAVSTSFVNSTLVFSFFGTGVW